MRTFANQVMGQMATGDYEAVYEQSLQTEVERIEAEGGLIGFRFLALGADTEGTEFIFKEQVSSLSMVQWEALPVAANERRGKKVYTVLSEPNYEAKKSTGVFVFIESGKELKFLGVTEKDNSYLR